MSAPNIPARPVITTRPAPADRAELEAIMRRALARKERAA